METRLCCDTWKMANCVRQILSISIILILFRETTSFVSTLCPLCLPLIHVLLHVVPRRGYIFRQNEGSRSASTTGWKRTNILFIFIFYFFVGQLSQDSLHTWMETRLLIKSPSLHEQPPPSALMSPSCSPEPCPTAPRRQCRGQLRVRSHPCLRPVSLLIGIRARQSSPAF